MYTPDSLHEVKTESCVNGVTGLKIEDQLMALGFSNGIIEMFDLEKCMKVRKLEKHEGRVASLMFMDGLLVSGSKDRSILVHDLRQREHVVK